MEQTREAASPAARSGAAQPDRVPQRSNSGLRHFGQDSAAAGLAAAVAVAVVSAAVVVVPPAVAEDLAAAVVQPADGVAAVDRLPFSDKNTTLASGTAATRLAR